MTLVMPPELEGLAYLVAGHFPDGDEDGMRRLGDAWSDAADGLREAAERSAAADRHGSDGMTGETHTALTQNRRQVTDDLINQSAYCDSMARQCYEGANGIELYKLTTIGALAMLALQLAADGALWWAGGGLKAAADTAATRTAVLTGFRELLGKLVWWGAKRTAERRGLPLAVKAGLVSAAQEGIVNAGAQWYQIQQGNRDSVDMTSLGISVAAGGAGGAAAGELMRRYMSPVFDRFGAVAGTLMLGGAGGVIGGGAGLTVSIGLTGQVPSGDDLTEVLVSGIGGGLLGAAGTAARMSRASAFGPPTRPGTAGPGPSSTASRPPSAPVGSPPLTPDTTAPTTRTAAPASDNTHSDSPSALRDSPVPGSDGDRSLLPVSDEVAAAQPPAADTTVPQRQESPSRFGELVDRFAGAPVTDEVGALVGKVDHIHQLRATIDGLESKIAGIENGIRREQALLDSWGVAIENTGHQDAAESHPDSLPGIRRDFATIVEQRRAEQDELSEAADTRRFAWQQEVSRLGDVADESSLAGAALNQLREKLGADISALRGIPHQEGLDAAVHLVEQPDGYLDVLQAQGWTSPELEQISAKVTDYLRIEATVSGITDAEFAHQPGGLISTVAEAPRTRTERGYTRGRDRTDELDYLAIGARLDDRESTDNDPALGAIYSAQGFDGLPVLADARALDALVAEGGQQLFRGLTDPGYVHEFQHGAYYPGVSVVHVAGNGTYATTERAVALNYADDQPDGVIRMVLRPDARIGNADELHQLRNEALAANQAERHQLDQIIPRTPEIIARQELLSKRWDVLQDVGRFAAASGYDAYPLDFGMSGHNDTYWIVLNRTAVVVEYNPPEPATTDAPDRPATLDHEPGSSSPDRARTDGPPPLTDMPGDTTTDRPHHHSEDNEPDEGSSVDSELAQPTDYDPDLNSDPVNEVDVDWADDFPADPALPLWPEGPPYADTDMPPADNASDADAAPAGDPHFHDSYGTSDSGIEGIVNSDGSLFFWVRKSTETPPGHLMFRDLMTAVGDNVRTIHGHWMATENARSNLDEFNAGIRSELTPEEAAQNTFTGRWARDWGFTEVTVSSEDGFTGHSSTVNAKFTRPEDSAPADETGFITDHEYSTHSGTTVAGEPGPGITPEMLSAARDFVADRGESLVIFGSRQTGISEKSGRPFRPDSDLDLAAVDADGLMELTAIYFEDGIPIPEASAPAGIFSVPEALERGYLAILPGASSDGQATSSPETAPGETARWESEPDGGAPTAPEADGPSEDPGTTAQDIGSGTAADGTGEANEQTSPSGSPVNESDADTRSANPTPWTPRQEN